MAAPSTTVFIGSIPFDATEQQIHEIFSTIGPIKALRLVSDRDTGKPKGYAFCEYHDTASAESAVRNLNGHEMQGRQLRVGYAEEHQQMRDGKRSDYGRDRERDRDRDFRDRDRDRKPDRGPALASGPPGSKPVGAAGANAAAGAMAAMLGDRTIPGPDQGKVNSLLGSMSPIQLYQLMNQMKGFIQQNPAQARQTLINHPQLTKALFQAQILLGMVKPPPGINIHPPGTTLAPAIPVPAPAAAPLPSAAATVPPPAATTQQPAVLPAPGGQQPLLIAPGGGGSAAAPFTIAGPSGPLQVIVTEGAQGVQYSLLQPGGLPGQAMLAALPTPAPAAAQPAIPAAQPAATAPAPAPAALPSDQQAILAQVMGMTQQQIDALPEGTRQQVMQVKALLMHQAGAAVQ